MKRISQIIKFELFLPSSNYDNNSNRIYKNWTLSHEEEVFHNNFKATIHMQSCCKEEELMKNILLVLAASSSYKSLLKIENKARRKFHIQITFDPNVAKNKK